MSAEIRQSFKVLHKSGVPDISHLTCKVTLLLLAEPLVQLTRACMSQKQNNQSHQSYCADGTLVLLILLCVKLHIDPQPACTWTHNHVCQSTIGLCGVFFLSLSLFGQRGPVLIYKEKYDNSMTQQRECVEHMNVIFISPSLTTLTCSCQDCTYKGCLSL